MVPPRWGPDELVELDKISGPTRCDELTATFAGAVAAILPSGAADPQLAPLLGASAHSAAAFLQRSAAAECRARAETVDEIAKPFPADRALQHERISAWRFVGHAFRADLAQCRACAEIVDRIATPFPDDVGMQHERAMAWRFVAWAARHDPAQCRCYAERVDAIALPFPGHRDFAYERVQAWCYLVSATVADLGACHAHAETVDGIAAACPGDRDVQAIRIEAWGSLVQASIGRTRTMPGLCGHRRPDRRSLSGGPQHPARAGPGVAHRHLRNPGSTHAVPHACRNGRSRRHSFPGRLRGPILNARRHGAAS